MTILAYEVLKFTYSATEVNIILWAIYAGIVLACTFSLIDKKLSHEIVNGLLALEANTPETALTLTEAGVKHKKLALFYLKKGKKYRKTIFLANETDYIVKTNHSKLIKIIYKILSIHKEEKEILDVNTAKFYIPEEKRIHAEVSMNQKKGNSAILLIICIVVFAIAMLFLSYAIPKLLDFLDSTLAGFNK